MKLFLKKELITDKIFQSIFFWCRCKEVEQEGRCMQTMDRQDQGICNSETIFSRALFSFFTMHLPLSDQSWRVWWRMSKNATAAVARGCLMRMPTSRGKLYKFCFRETNIYIPKMKNKKKRSFILMRTQIGFNLKCIAQCICSKSSGLTFLDNVWFGMFERSLRPVLRVADSP